MREHIVTAPAVICQRRHFCTGWKWPDVTRHRSHSIPCARAASSPKSEPPRPLSDGSPTCCYLPVFGSGTQLNNGSHDGSWSSGMSGDKTAIVHTFFFFLALRDKICWNASKRWTLNEHAARVTQILPYVCNFSLKILFTDESVHACASHVTSPIALVIGQHSCNANLEVADDDYDLQAKKCYFIQYNRHCVCISVLRVFVPVRERKRRVRETDVPFCFCVRTRLLVQHRHLELFGSLAPRYHKCLPGEAERKHSEHWGCCLNDKSHSLSQSRSAQSIANKRNK